MSDGNRFHNASSGDLVGQAGLGEVSALVVRAGAEQILPAT
jgi:hypothetical protein